MSDLIGLSNALTWVHFQLRGGWKRNVALTIGGMIVVGALMMLSVIPSSGAGRYSSTMWGWAQGLLVLEAAILVLYGSAVVGSAIRTDITEGMIESHRLMPISAMRAVGGYLLGGGLSALVPACGVIILDLFAALASHVPMDRWLMSQGTLAVLTGTIWLVAAAGSFMGRLSGNVLVALIVIGFFASHSLFVFLPGLLVLTVPSIAQISLKSWGPVDKLIFVALVFQGLLAALFFIAAIRRYARDDVSSFGVLPGLGLVALWCAMSFVGMTQYQTIHIGRNDLPALATQCICSLSILMLLALVPLANAARAARARVVGSPSSRRHQAWPMIVVAAGSVLALLLTFVLMDSSHPFWVKSVQTLVIIATWLAGMRFLLGWVYQAVPRGLVIGFIWMLLTWFAPMLCDVVSQSVLYPDRDYTAGWLFAASPLGR